MEARSPSSESAGTALMPTLSETHNRAVFQLGMSSRRISDARFWSASRFLLQKRHKCWRHSMITGLALTVPGGFAIGAASRFARKETAWSNGLTFLTRGAAG